MSDLNIVLLMDGRFAAIRSERVDAIVGAVPGRKAASSILMSSGERVDCVLGDCEDVAEKLGLGSWEKAKAPESTE